MPALYVCTDNSDASTVRELTGSDTLTLPQHFAAAAGRTGASIERISARVSTESDTIDPVIVTLLIRSSDLAGVNQVSHVTAGNEVWFSDLTVGGRYPTTHRSESVDAWAFAAACALLPPESIIAFAAPLDESSLVRSAVDSTNTLVHALIRSANRHRPDYVRRTVHLFHALGEHSRLTVTQRSLLSRAATEAAVRLRAVPDLPASLSPADAGKSARDRAFSGLLSRLENMGRA